MTTPLLHPSATVTLASEELRASSGDVTLDASLAPYGTARVEVPLLDPEMIELIDPRDELRVSISATATGRWEETPGGGSGFGDGLFGAGPFGGGSTSTITWVPEDVRTFDLGLRSREVDHVAKQIILELATDEALLMDYAPLAVDAGARAHETSLRAVCNYVLSKIGASLAAGAWDADVTAYWTVTNLVENPSFEVNTSGTATSVGASSFTAWTMASPTAVLGTKALRFTAAAGEASVYPAGWDTSAAAFKAIRVTPGQTYTASLYAVGSTARSAGVTLQFRGENGTTIVSQAAGPVSSETSGAWKRYSVTSTAPAGAAFASILFTTTGNAAGQFHYVDAVMLHEGSEVIPAFDGTSATDANYVYAWAGDAHASQSTRTPTVERSPELFRWEPGVTAWEFLSPLTSQAGLRLFCDEQRVWRLIDPAEYSVPGRLSIAGWNATEGVDKIDRADPNVFCTGVVVRYRWRDEAGTEHVAFDSAGASGKVLVWEYERPYPGPGAATAILARRASAGRVQDVTALADWGATPGMEASIALPATLEQVGTLTSVKWTLTDGLMQVGTRGLIDVLPGSIDALVGTIDSLAGTIDAL